MSQNGPIDNGQPSAASHRAGTRRSWTIVHEHRMVAGAIVGMGFAIANHLLTRYWPWTLGRFLDPSLLFGVAIMVLALVCWPLVRYSDCMRVGATFSGGILALGSINMLIIWPDREMLFPWLFPVAILGSFVVLWVVSCGILSVATYVRTRYWPLYAEGHCRECGYNLFGAPGPNCPECGVACPARTDNGKGSESP